MDDYLWTASLLFLLNDEINGETMVWCDETEGTPDNEWSPLALLKDQYKIDVRRLTRE